MIETSTIAAGGMGRKQFPIRPQQSMYQLFLQWITRRHREAPENSVSA
jgi:hypothetical protein